MASWSDNFNRANGPLGANYTQMFTDGPTASVVSNRAQKNTTAGSVRYHYTALALSSSHAIQATLFGHTASGSYIGVYCSGSNSPADLSGYVIFFGNGNEWVLQRRNAAGTPVNIASGTTTLANGDVARIERNASTGAIVVTLNGNAITSQNNTLYTGLYGGVEFSASTQPSIDDLSGTDLVSPLELIAQRARMGLRGRTATLTLAENRTLIAQRARAALRGRVATLTLANNLTLDAVRARLAVRGRSAVLTLDNELVLTSRPATVALRGREAALTLTGGLTLIAQPARVAVRGRTADINLVGNFSLDAQPARLGLRGAVATLTIVTPTPSPVDDGLLSPKLIARAPNPWVRVGGTERKRKKPEPVADAPAPTTKPSRLLGGILARAGIAQPAAPGIRTAIAPAAAPQPVVAAPADAAPVPQPVVSPAPRSTAAPAPASAFTPFTPAYVGVNGVNDDELRNLRREVARAVANVRDELLAEQQAMADALADLRGESEAAAIEAAAMAEQVAELRAALAEQRDRADGLAAEVAALRKQLRQRQAVEAAARLLVD